MNQSNQNPSGNGSQQFNSNQAPRPTGTPPRQGQAPRQPMGQVPRQGQAPRQPMGQAPRQGQAPHQPMGQTSRQGQVPRQPMRQTPRPTGVQSHQSGQVPYLNEQAQQSMHSHHASQPVHQTINAQQANANNIPPFLTTMKGIAIALGGAVMLGLLLGLMMGGGSSSQPKTQCSGFEKLVIRNKDITNRMPLCGRTDRGQACLLYIMNTSRYDETAEKFFKKAAELTGMQNYSIQMVNPQYAKQRIPAGHFVEIKIPAMK